MKFQEYYNEVSATFSIAPTEAEQIINENFKPLKKENEKAVIPPELAQTAERYRELYNNNVEEIGPDGYPWYPFGSLIVDWIKNRSLPALPTHQGQPDMVNINNRNIHDALETIHIVAGLDKERRKEFFKSIGFNPGQFAAFRDQLAKFLGRETRSEAEAREREELRRNKTLGCRNRVPEDVWKPNIRLVYMSSNYMVWGTKSYDATTYVFISTLWDTENPMTGDYGKPEKGSPYCTKQLNHWKFYERLGGGPGKYEQFWVLKNPGLPRTNPGNCLDGTVLALFNRLEGKGPETLLGNVDTGLDILDRFDAHKNDWIDDEIAYVFRHIFPNREQSQFRINDGELLKYVGDPFQVGDEIVVIPDSVTKIGRSAFQGRTRLTSVTIPDSVTSIEDYAFERCSGLTSVTIPDSVKSIGWGAFDGCSGLTSVTIPDSVKSIGNAAFYGCSRLTSVTIPDGVVRIREWTFWGCEKLTSVTIPKSVMSIEGHAFTGCEGLTSVAIPNSVTSIEDHAFERCFGLTSVTIPDSVKSIGGYAFRDCKRLRSVTIGSGVSELDLNCFDGCILALLKFKNPNTRIVSDETDLNRIHRHIKSIEGLKEKHVFIKPSADDDDDADAEAERTLESLSYEIMCGRA